MKKVLIIAILFSVINGIWAQQFSIPKGAVLIESTEFKNAGITYIIEQRYKLLSGETMYVYYDADGTNSVTIQKLEQTPLAIGNEIKISGMPGYREFNFGEDRRKLVQFMKIMKLGEKYYKGGAKTPSLSDSIFTIYGHPFVSEFKLLLDLFDETWVLEHNEYHNGRISSINTTAILRVKAYSE